MNFTLKRQNFDGWKRTPVIKVFRPKFMKQIYRPELPDMLEKIQDFLNNYLMLRLVNYINQNINNLSFVYRQLPETKQKIFIRLNPALHFHQHYLKAFIRPIKIIFLKKHLSSYQNNMTGDREIAISDTHHLTSLIHFYHFNTLYRSENDDIDAFFKKNSKLGTDSLLLTFPRRVWEQEKGAWEEEKKEVLKRREIDTLKVLLSSKKRIYQEKRFELTNPNDQRLQQNIKAIKERDRYIKQYGVTLKYIMPITRVSPATRNEDYINISSFIYKDTFEQIQNTLQKFLHIQKRVYGLIDTKQFIYLNSLKQVTSNRDIQKSLLEGKPIIFPVLNHGLDRSYNPIPFLAFSEINLSLLKGGAGIYIKEGSLNSQKSFFYSGVSSLNKSFYNGANEEQPLQFALQKTFLNKYNLWTDSQSWVLKDALTLIKHIVNKSSTVEEQYHNSSLSYIYTNRQQDFMFMLKSSRQVEEKELMERVERKIKEESNRLEKRYSQVSSPAEITDQVYNHLTRRLQLEKERLGY